MKSILLRTLLGLVLLLLLALMSVHFIFESRMSQKFSRPDFSISEEVAKSDIELGRRIYMVRSGCVDCHGENLAGVKVMENPAMGVIFGANISSSSLKNWSDEEIAGAIRYGIHKEGRSLRFMPSFDFIEMSRGDLAALIAFLRSSAEVNQPSHENKFGPMAKILSSFGKMPIMFPAMSIDLTKGFAEKPLEATSIEFGRYLASACVGCHGNEFHGGPIPGGDPSWPPASNIRLGANQVWSELKFREMIQTDVSPTSGSQIRAPMPLHLLKQMNDQELTSMWMYFSSLK